MLTKIINAFYSQPLLLLFFPSLFLGFPKEIEKKEEKEQNRLSKTTSLFLDTLFLEALKQGTRTSNVGTVRVNKNRL